VEAAVLDQRNFNRRLIELNTVQVYTKKQKRKERYFLWFKYEYEVLVFDSIKEERELLSLAPSDIINVDFRSFRDVFVSGVEGVPEDVRNERYIRIQVLYPDTAADRRGQLEVVLIARANQYEDIRSKIAKVQIQ